MNYTSKDEYRDYLRKMSVMLKMKYFLKIANIPESTFSKFLRDEYYNELLSVQKLENLISVIKEKLT